MRDPEHKYIFFSGSQTSILFSMYGTLASWRLAVTIHAWWEMTSSSLMKMKFGWWWWHWGMMLFLTRFVFVFFAAYFSECYIATPVQGCRPCELWHNFYLYISTSILIQADSILIYMQQCQPLFECQLYTNDR